MVFTIKKLIIFFIFLGCVAHASEKMTYKLNDNSLLIKFNANVNKESVKIIEYDKSIEVDFKTKEKINVSQEFWGVPVSKVYSKQEGDNVKLIFDFIGHPVKPSISFDNKNIYFKIIFPKEKAEGQYKSSSVYYRLIVGLLLIIVFILVMVFFMKLFLKKNINSELPGVGRVLGKVDIMPGKSIVFFELAESIYLLGISSDRINKIDKITDEVEINMIKSGFTAKNNFSSYLKFFSRNDLNKDLDVTSTIIKDKVDKLKKK